MVRIRREDDVTRIGGIATLSDDGQYSHIILTRSWNGKRVFALLKSEYDKMKREEQRGNTKAIGVFARGLIGDGSGRTKEDD
jgi:hypothetical protein